MADDGQTAVLDGRNMDEMPIGHSETPDSNSEGEQEAAVKPELVDLASEKDETHILDADAMRTQTQIELDRVEYIGDYFDALIHSPSNIRKKQLDADIDKLNAEIEALQQKADKIIENKNLREKAEDATQKRGEAALDILKDSIARNVTDEDKESAKAEVYTALLNISRDIKRTLKKEYSQDDSFPVKDILPALALHLYEDGNIQSAEDLDVLSSAEEIGSTTAGVIASHENAIVEEQNKKNKRLKKLHGDIAKKNDEIARKNEEKQEITPETIREERAEFLRTRPNLRNSLNTLGHYKKSLDIALEAPSAEAYFAGNEDVLAIFSHMDSELGEDADSIALKRNDDRKRYFITLKNLDEERFDELVKEAQYDMAKLADLRAKEEIEENPLWTEKDYDVADLVDQDRHSTSLDYIPTFEALDKLAESVDLNTAAPEQTAKSDKADEKIVDALRSHMDAMVENYLPTEKQLKKAQKTTLGNRIKSLIQRVTGTRDKVKKERIEPTISDEEMDAAMDKLVDPESDDESGPKNDDTPEESADKDDHDKILFADVEDDLLDPEPEQPDLPFGDEEKAASGDKPNSEEPIDAEFEEGGTGKPTRENVDQEPIDAEYDEVEKTEDPDQDDKPKVAKDGRQADTTNPTMTTGILAATFGIAAAGGAALLGIDINAENMAVAAASGATLGMFVDSVRKMDTKKMIGQMAVAGAVSWGVKSLGFAGLSMLGTAGFLPVIAGIGICAIAGGLASMASTALFDKSENRNLGSAFIRGAITGGIIGAFAPMLGELFSGNGADSALAGGQNADVTANGAENAGLGDGEPDAALDQTLAPDPEARIEPGAGGDSNLGENADLADAPAPDFGNMSAVEIREAAGVMYTEGDYQGALDALNVALEKAPDWLDESIKGDIANIAMVHGLDTGAAGANFDSASDMLRSSFAEAGQEGHSRNEDYLRMLMEKRDLLSPSGGPSMS